MAEQQETHELGLGRSHPLTLSPAGYAEAVLSERTAELGAAIERLEDERRLAAEELARIDAHIHNLRERRAALSGFVEEVHRQDWSARRG